MSSAFHFLWLAALYRKTAAIPHSDKARCLDMARFYLRLAHDCPRIVLP